VLAPALAEATAEIEGHLAARYALPPGKCAQIIDSIPVSLRLAVSTGIGLFITFIGLQGMGLIVDNPATLVGIGPITKPVILGLFGLILIAVLEIRKVRGALLIGIAITTILGVVFKVVALPHAMACVR